MKKFIKKLIGFIKGLFAPKWLVHIVKKPKIVICDACRTEIKVYDFNKVIKCPHCKHKFFMKPPSS